MWLFVIFFLQYLSLWLCPVTFCPWLFVLWLSVLHSKIHMVRNGFWLWYEIAILWYEMVNYGTKWLWYEMTCFGILHRWSYKGDVSLFFDFTVGYIQISFQESNSFICFLTDICYMTFPLQVWCNCYAQAGFYKYDGRKLWLMINRFPDMDPYFTEINNVLLGSRGYEYDGFLLSKMYCFYFIKWQFMNFLYNFLFVVYFYSNKIWCIEKLVLQ